MPELGFRSGKIYLRCPYCGDSTEENHGHLVVYISSGAFRCLRCDAEGQLSFADQIELYDRYTKPTYKVLGTEPKTTSALLPQPGAANWNRPSLVSRRFQLLGTYDIFEGKDLLRGEVQGYHVRDSVKKQSRNLGPRAFGLCKPPQVGTQIRLVEGPYDVVDPIDVCAYGLLLSQQQLRQLRFFRLILCPDGDIWTSELKMRNYFTQFRGFVVSYVEKIDGDPDEVPISEREIIPWPLSRNVPTESKLTWKWPSLSQSEPHVLGPEWGF